MFEQDPVIQAMASLRKAYETHDVNTMEAVVSSTIRTDEVLREFEPDLLSITKNAVALRTLKAYRKVSIDFLGKKLNKSHDEVVDLVKDLILGGTLDARVDEPGGFIVCRNYRGGAGGVSAGVGAAVSGGGVPPRAEVLENWVGALNEIKDSFGKGVHEAFYTALQDVGA